MPLAPRKRLHFKTLTSTKIDTVEPPQERSPKAPVLTARANRLPDSFWAHVSVGCYPYDGLAMRAVNSDLVERNVPILKIALVEYNENVGANASRVVS